MSRLHRRNTPGERCPNALGIKEPGLTARLSFDSGGPIYFALVPKSVETVWPVALTVIVTLYVAVESASDFVARL